MTNPIFYFQTIGAKTSPALEHQLDLRSQKKTMSLYISDVPEFVYP